jgi:hypothetical protein
MTTSLHAASKNIRSLVTVSLLYALTVTFVVATMVHPYQVVNHQRLAALTLKKSEQVPHVPIKSVIPVISGQPIRIVIPSESLDLPVDPGYYDPTSGGWTLSGYHAQFAMLSTLANNISGNTFIYGHNNDYVFGALRHNTPGVGALAFIYTSNGHIFEYAFQSVQSLSPTDVSALAYNGPSVLTIQTCTGSLNEWRTMYRFTFAQVVQ